MTVKKTEKKAEAKAEKKLAKAVEKAVESAEPKRNRRARVSGMSNGSYARQAALQKHAATANFIAGLFNPFDSPSRFPDKMNMLKTVVLPFRETGTISGASWAIEIAPILQRMLHAFSGTIAFGATSIVATFPNDKMFTAAAGLTGFILSARCTGLKLRLQYSYVVTSAQGYVVAAIIPPGSDGSAMSQSALSQLPMSAAASTPDIVTTGAFEICWLPQRGASNYLSAYSGQALQPYDPLEFVPFNDETEGISGGMPVIQAVASGQHSSAVYMMTIEGTFECDCICGALIGSDVRPSEDAFEVLEDYAEPLFEEFSGVVPETLSERKQALAPQAAVVQQMMTTVPERMSEPTASFLDTAGPVLSAAGEKAWDLVKEYGPDVLETAVGLLPGGSLAATATKLGAALGKFLF